MLCAPFVKGCFISFSRGVLLLCDPVLDYMCLGLGYIVTIVISLFICHCMLLILLWNVIELIYYITNMYFPSVVTMNHDLDSKR